MFVGADRDKTVAKRQVITLRAKHGKTPVAQSFVTCIPGKTATSQNNKSDVKLEEQLWTGRSVVIQTTMSGGEASSHILSNMRTCINAAL